jgi:phage-related minor tail protein
LNHAPLFALAAGFALLVWGVARNSYEVRLIARIAFVLAASAAVAVYFTGKAAEDVVENLPGVLERAIELHEDVGTAALLAIGATGIIAAIGLTLHRASETLRRVSVGALFAMSLVAFGITAWAANAGGAIRHPEILNNATSVSADRR